MLEKFSHVLRKHEKFMTYLNIFIYKSWLMQQFEDKYGEMVENFQLWEDRGWMNSVFV